MLRLLYRALTDVSALPLAGWLRYRARRGKEIASRLPERRGVASLARPEGHVAWIHAASIGESLSILPLIAELGRRGWRVLLTSGTVTSAALIAERFPPEVLHQFTPLDRLGWVRRFLDHWRPDLVLRTDSELWPNTLAEIGRRGIPLVQMNARLSDRAFRGWQRWPSFARDVVSSMSLVLAQSAEDRERFAALGAKDVRVTGNLKLAPIPLPADPEAAAQLRRDTMGRPMWLAASIHPGEDAIAATVHRGLKARFPDLLTIIVPRHADKGRAMAETMTGLRCGLRSETKTIGRDVDVYIADSMGELGLFYGLCDLVFMGKSLAVGGGQNPAEPALIGCALVLGPDMSNFRELTGELVEAGAALQVPDAQGLQSALELLLGDHARRAAVAAAGRAYMARQADGLKNTMDALSPYLAGAKIR
jgi:3-deoxy-D-manno-octulosonic-acid transferase